MQGEFEYYSALSGLTPPQSYSLADHQDAYWGGSEYSFLSAQTGMTGAAIDDMELVFWRGLSGLDAGLTVADYMHYCLINNLTPGGSSSAARVSDLTLTDAA